MTNDELLKKIYDDTQMMKTELKSVKETTEGLTIGLKEVQEDTKIRILAENHLSLMKRLDEAIQVSNRYFIYEMKLNSLDNRVTKLEHLMYNNP